MTTIKEEAKAVEEEAETEGEAVEAEGEGVRYIPPLSKPLPCGNTE